MAKHDTDPVLGHLVHAVNESGQTQVPVTVSACGTVLAGILIAQDAYFTQLAGGQAAAERAPAGFGLAGQGVRQGGLRRSGPASAHSRHRARW